MTEVVKSIAYIEDALNTIQKSDWIDVWCMFFQHVKNGFVSSYPETSVTDDSQAYDLWVETIARCTTRRQPDRIPVSK